MLPEKSPNIETLRQFLLAWGKENVRDYPWRWLTDPYSVLVAEFMLHRTQVRQVEPIYVRFIAAYPTLGEFINSDLSEVENLLNALGLYWRIQGLIQALIELWRTYGEVPTDPQKLLAITGIGPYIAGATFCFSQNRPVALVDTNTVRVIGRVFGLDTSGEARRRKTVITAIEESCDPTQPRDYYYALIDLAHLICRPKNPMCSECPLLNVPCTFGNKSIHGE